MRDVLAEGLLHEHKESLTTGFAPEPYSIRKLFITRLHYLFIRDYLFNLGLLARWQLHSRSKPVEFNGGGGMPIDKVASNRPVQWILCGGGTDYVYQSFLPIRPARRHVFHSNNRAPWIMSNTSGTPIGALHYDNDSVTILEGQWRRRSVKSANRGSHLQWAMTTLKSKPSEAEKHGLIHTEVRDPPHPTWTLLQPWHMPSWQCHTPVFWYWFCFYQTRKRLRGPPPQESNLSKGFFSCATQLSLRSVRNIKPNKQAPADGLHGCIPSWFQYTLLQPKQRHQKATSCFSY